MRKKSLKLKICTKTFGSRKLSFLKKKEQVVPKIKWGHGKIDKTTFSKNNPLWKCSTIQKMIKNYPSDCSLPFLSIYGLVSVSEVNKDYM